MYTRFARARRPRVRGLMHGVLFLACAGGASVALAQMPVNTQVNMQLNMASPSGRLLDANPMLGGSGYNSARPTTPLSAGNLAASGLASRGLSLRSYSPISSPTAFRGSLGSGTLSDFRRDSVSVETAPLGRGALGQAYLDPNTTVPTAGLLQGLSSLPMTQGQLGAQMGESRATGALRWRMDMRLDDRGSMEDQLSTMRPGISAVPGVLQQGDPAQRRADWSTQSTIFGTQRPPDVLPPAEQEPPWRQWAPRDPPQTRLRGESLRLDPRQDTRMDLRVTTPEDILGTPLDVVLRSEVYRPDLSAEAASMAVPPWAIQPGPAEPTAMAEAEVSGPLARQGLIAPDPSVMPGYDVLTDMQLALALQAEPDATWFGEMQAAVQEDPSLASTAQMPRGLTAEEFVQQALEAPLRTMTGGGASAVNDQMLKAESLLDIGRYAEAADRYESASQMDPDNPLPLLGKGHALLAAGMYESAAQALLRGIALADSVPGLARTLLNRMDLTALMGGGEVIDMRRARLMELLDTRENPELRFLLGYLEYHSGNREQGLKNLQRAADDPRAGLVIGRYPTLVGSPVSRTTDGTNPELTTPPPQE